MLTDPNKCNVCVLRGGPSLEYDLSLDSGAHVLMSLEERHPVNDILIDRDGKWFKKGKNVKPEQAFWDVDVAFNALHGAYGEDGTVQKIFEAYTVPYTGSGPFSSITSLNKHTAKKFFKVNGIKIPHSKLVKKEDGIKNITMNIFNSMPLPLIIKPVAMGSSRGVAVVSDFMELEREIAKAFEISSELLIEEYIKGDVVSCGVIEDFRDEDFYSLVPVHIKLPENNIFLDYEKRHKLIYDIPAKFDADVKKKIQDYAKLAHAVLGLRHYSQSDFIISPTRGVYLLETNSLPHLGQKAPFIGALEAVGSGTDEFVEHIIGLALK